MSTSTHTFWMRRAALAAAIALSSCSSGSEAEPPVPTSTFNTLVLDQFQATSDTTEPVPIAGRDFTFSDDPNAFNSLFE